MFTGAIEHYIVSVNSTGSNLGLLRQPMHTWSWPGQKKQWQKNISRCRLKTTVFDHVAVSTQRTPPPPTHPPTHQSSTHPACVELRRGTPPLGPPTAVGNVVCSSAANAPSFAAVSPKRDTGASAGHGGTAEGILNREGGVGLQVCIICVFFPECVAKGSRL